MLEVFMRDLGLLATSAVLTFRSVGRSGSQTGLSRKSCKQRLAAKQRGTSPLNPLARSCLTKPGLAHKLQPNFYEDTQSDYFTCRAFAVHSDFDNSSRRIPSTPFHRAILHAVNRDRRRVVLRLGNA